MKGKIFAKGTCWHDGELLELDREDGEMIDITCHSKLIEKPLSGKWLEKYPDFDFYVEIDEFTQA